MSFVLLFYCFTVYAHYALIAQTMMSYESVQLPMQTDLSKQFTEAFLMKENAGQRPTEKGHVSKSVLFRCPHVICHELPSL